MTKRKLDDSYSALSARNMKPRNDHRQKGSPSFHSEREDAPQNHVPVVLPPLPQISAAMSQVVFTHSSTVSNKDNKTQSASYERLELLGDAYIEVMATRLIWGKFKHLPTGRLSQIRELLVNNKTLAEIAVQYGLDKHITTSCDVRENDRRWLKVRGDVIEAYVAALVLEDEEMGGPGYKAAEKWLHQAWLPKLRGVLYEKAPNLNAKDELARKVVSRGVTLEYLEEMPAKQLGKGQQNYFIGVFITGWGFKKQCLGSGQGLNKTKAGNLAAENALLNPLIDEMIKEKRKHDKERIDGREHSHGEHEAAQSSSGREKVTQRAC